MRHGAEANGEPFVELDFGGGERFSMPAERAPERPPLPEGFPCEGGFSCCVQCGALGRDVFCPDADAYPCPKLKSRGNKAAPTGAGEQKTRRRWPRRRTEQQ